MKRRRINRASALLAGLLLASAGAGAASLEYPELYKTPRALGMGGAGVALAASDGPDALFTNPARLAGMSEGWEFQPFSLTLASSERSESFIRRLGDALDIEDTDTQREALVDILRHYRGGNLHGEGVLLPAVSWRRGRLAVGGAWMLAAKGDGRSHEGFGAGGLLDINARTLSGPVAGAAWTAGNWRLGATLKHLRRDRVDRRYSVRELVELTDAGWSLSDDLRDGSDTGLDFGLQYGWTSHSWAPRVGLVLQNVGGMDFGPAGDIPQTVSVGVSLRPPVERIARLTLAAEYFDVLHRMPQDDSQSKRLRLGAEWRLWQREGSGLALRAGLYQRALTAGIEWQVGWLRIGVATYAEEQGAHPGQDRDRRYLLSTALAL